MRDGRPKFVIIEIHEEHVTQINFRQEKCLREHPKKKKKKKRDFAYFVYPQTINKTYCVRGILLLIILY